jgi:hypothetical protein
VAKSKVAAIISMGGDILPSFSKMRVLALAASPTRWANL